MSIANFKPNIWSARLQANLDKALVFGGLVTRDWEGEIREMGDSVRINRPNNLTVNDYAGTVSYESPTSAQTILTIDQQKYVAFKVSDIDQAQANVDLIDAYANRAAYALADAVDQHLASLYTAAGAGTVTLDLTAATPAVYDAFVEARKLLNKQNVPSNGRWVVVSPDIEASLLKDDKFVQSTDQGDNIRMTGRIGGIAGFDVYVSNNVPTVTDAATGAVYHKAVFGYNDAIAFAGQFTKIEVIRGESSFDDLFRSLYLFGAKVIEANGLGVIDARVA
ncbi:P22 phage major capsid protein family protein [Oceanithermus sp.]|uniref:P22 phage major capsid protein family protein n=1 Tax=Oceanithermus sp. TaxID=2268145 RepID=UPI00257ED63A|nr:P22 phage major capsid protein family protein [Oceanithermus sp.]